MKSLLGNYQLNVADVGAAGGIDSRWSFLKSNLFEILFEPDPESFLELEKTKKENSIAFNSALFDMKKEVILNICQWRQVSSIYEPNFDFIKNFPQPERFKVIEKIKMEADSLSNLLNSAGIMNLDFLKIDTQGSELEILTGAGQYLESVIGIEVEVEFVELYKDQPLFDEVHEFITSHGLSLIDIKRSFWNRDQKFNNKGQLIFADGLYLRKPESILENECTAEKVLKAVAVYLAYGYYDLANYISNEAFKNKIITHDQFKLIASYLTNSVRIPNFKGKARIKIIFDFLSEIFNDNKFSNGTDDKLGN